MKQVFIGLGSNLDDPISQLKKAIIALKKIAQTKLIRVSSFYQSKPLDNSEQPEYINAVAELETQMDAWTLLQKLQEIENNQGRVRTTHWGARVIDLDILLYGDEIINTAELTVPHAGIKEREFVLYPLSEIAGDLIFPTGESLAILKKQCPSQSLRKLDEKNCRISGNV